MFIITGLLLGLFTLVFIGPVLFYLIKASIEDGRKAGYAVALGIITGDIIYVLLVLFGAGDYFNQPKIKWWMLLVTAIVLLTMGLKNLLLKEAHNKKVGQTNQTLFKHFLNGFIINFVNPFVLAIWILFLSYNQGLYATAQVITSLAITLAVIFLTDCLKAFYSEKLNSILTLQKLLIINKVVGVLFIVFALRFFYLCF
jgi:threonine/homoserine/homoserine lactone efflux protein